MRKDQELILDVYWEIKAHLHDGTVWDTALVAGRLGVEVAKVQVALIQLSREKRIQISQAGKKIQIVLLEPVLEKPAPSALPPAVVADTRSTAVIDAFKEAEPTPREDLSEPAEETLAEGGYYGRIDTLVLADIKTAVNSKQVWQISPAALRIGFDAASVSKSLKRLEAGGHICATRHGAQGVGIRITIAGGGTTAWPVDVRGHELPIVTKAAGRPRKFKAEQDAAPLPPGVDLPPPQAVRAPSKPIDHTEDTAAEPVSRSARDDEMTTDDLTGKVHAAMFACLSEGRAWNWQEEADGLGIDRAQLHTAVLDLCEQGLVTLASQGSGIVLTISVELATESWSVAA